MKSLILCICMLAGTAAAHAQYTDSTQYYTELSANGSYNQTNSSSAYLFNNSLRLGIRKKIVALNMTNTWIYGLQDQKLTNNDFNSTFDCNIYRLGPHAYYWLLANYTSSYSLRINNQLQAGGGIAYKVIDKKDALLNLSDGFIYEYSDVNVQDTVKELYSTCRNSLRVTLRYNAGIFSFNGTCFVQNSVLDISDYIVKANVGAGIKVRKWLTLNVSYVYNRFSRTDKENTLLTYGVTLEKYY